MSDSTRKMKAGKEGVIPAAELGSRETALKGYKNPVVKFLKILGPGITVGASDDDPSGIGTYAVAGASLGFATLWVALITVPLMTAVQFVSAKIGLATGDGIGVLLRKHYPRPLVYFVAIALVVANTINAGADIGAIAAAINLLLPIPAIVFVIPVSLGILAIQILGSYRVIERTFKWLALALLAYIGSALFSHPNVLDVLRGTLIPTIHLDKAFIGILVALLGTTISPYLFFWQASQVVEEEKSVGRKKLTHRQGATKRELRYALADTIAGMAFSEVVAYFIILSTGATLFVAGQTSIGSATEAAQALKPIAGEAATLLLAVGLIGAGVLAVPILTGSAAYGLSEAFRWRAGLDEKPHRAPQFYAVIVAATLVGMMINFVGINPITALVVSAVINGLIAAPIIVLVMLASNNRKVMGERTNGRLVATVGWITTIVMALAAIALIATSI